MSLLEFLQDLKKNPNQSLVDAANRHQVNHNAASVVKHTGMVEDGKWKGGKVTNEMVEEVREISNELSSGRWGVWDLFS